MLSPSSLLYPGSSVLVGMHERAPLSAVRSPNRHLTWSCPVSQRANTPVPASQPQVESWEVQLEEKSEPGLTKERAPCPAHRELSWGQGDVSTASLGALL